MFYMCNESFQDGSHKFEKGTKWKLLAVPGGVEVLLESVETGRTAVCSVDKFDKYFNKK